MNGWKRILVVASIILFSTILFFLYQYFSEDEVFNFSNTLLFWLGVVVVIYSLVWSVGWIIRGFKKKKI